MLENLLKLIKENAGEAIINNPAIPDVHNDAACETTANSIMQGLKDAIENGGLNAVKEIFQNGSSIADHPAVQNMSSNLAGNLMSKFGLDKDAAGNIVNNLLPTVMHKLVSKTNDPQDNSFNLQGILGALSGTQGKSGGILGSIENMIGKSINP